MCVCVCVCVFVCVCMSDPTNWHNNVNTTINNQTTVDQYPTICTNQRSNALLIESSRCSASGYNARLVTDTGDRSRSDSDSGRNTMNFQ